MTARPPDVPAILSRLKGFQRDTVEHAFHRLYEAPDSSHRFLVADEVGLGKTLVARGVVARTIEHLWPDIDRIDVIYICSNQAIAQQNVRRLSVFSEEATHSLDRLTLLPTAVSQLNRHKVNFVAFTPGTSFNLRSSGGTARERIVLYWLMQRIWPRDGVAPMNVFQGGVEKWRRFRERIRWFDGSPDTHLDEELTRRFGERLRQRVDEDRAAGRPTLEERYDELLAQFPRARSTPHPTHRREQFRFIGELRALLARTCVQALEPDLVILDEFQRFKELLDGDDEASRLAQQLFEYSDADTDVRILLLSATPYKMYTLHHESHEDDHYTDFLRTVEFLGRDEQRHERFEHQLGEYRRELYRLADGGDTDRLRSLKEGIESHLRRLMSRTERVRSTDKGDGMLTEVPPPRVPLQPGDVRAYQGLAKVAAEVNQPGVIEYWKSAPYLLSFMDDYKLKSNFEEALEVDGHALRQLLSEYPELQLPWRSIEDYDPIDPQNPRLRGLVQWLDETDAWRLLWLPPTLPYHRLGGHFRSAQASGLTKRLLFSSWAVVPKAIASMLSYEVERRIFAAHDPEARNTSEERKRRRPLLTFTFSQGRLTGMPVLGLLYPSPTLAEHTDPLTLGRARDPEASIEDVLAAARERLEPLVDRLVSEHAHPESTREDETWYWAAPILLDQAHRPESLAWLESRPLPAEWSGGEDAGDDESRWAEHVDRARELVAGEIDLGPPPDDLLDTLALLGVAGPANAALRALTRDGLGAAPLDSPEV
ncbi:MAG: DEAD/DEAH box helicase, partial [Acidobacteriota bacterium]